MYIRITGVGEKSAHSWYRDFIGQEFNVIGFDSLSQIYTVNTIGLMEQGKFNYPYAFVQKADAEIVSKQSEV